MHHQVRGFDCLPHHDGLDCRHEIGNSRFFKFCRKAGITVSKADDKEASFLQYSAGLSLPEEQLSAVAGNEQQRWIRTTAEPFLLNLNSIC